MRTARARALLCLVTLFVMACETKPDGTRCQIHVEFPLPGMGWGCDPCTADNCNAVPGCASAGCVEGVCTQSGCDGGDQPGRTPQSIDPEEDTPETDAGCGSACTA